MALFFRQLALDDLDRIWDYSLSRWGQKQTESYIRDVHSACVDLSNKDRVGLSAENILPGFRKYLIGQHVVYYKQENGDLIVYRILHQSMDVNSKGFNE